jgi:serine protease Do
LILASTKIKKSLKKSEKNMNKLLLILIAFLPISVKAQSLGKNRIERLKSSVVRIVVDGNANGSGTGFFVTEDGFLVTCWHVLEAALVRDKTNRSVIDIKKIEAEFSNGEKVEVQLVKSSMNDGHETEQIYDYAILKTRQKPMTKIIPLKIGKFDNINEGDQIYASGYPLGIKQQIPSIGILSTKWNENHVTIKRPNLKDSTIFRQVAWLDVTMNKGNSGGPVIRMGKSYKDDEIIGIATFILNPSGNAAGQLIEYYSEPHMDLKLDGISTNEINKLFATAISNNSIGVSGCISIQYLTNGLDKVNH